MMRYNTLKKKNLYSLLKYFYLTGLFYILAMPGAWATHLVGGSITYKELGMVSGYYHYQVTVDMFRDCTTPPNQSGPTPFDQQIDIGVYERSHDTALISTLTLTLGKELPVDGPTVSLNCPIQLPTICLREGIYVGDLYLQPSSYGYYLVHTRCCRNTMVNVPNSSVGQTYFAIIPPTSIQNTTPVFNAVPAPYICVDDTVSLLYSASEPDGDSLVYTLAQPYAGGDSSNPIPAVQPFFTNIPLVPYRSGYSPAYPLSKKGYASIDRITGVLTLYAPAIGKYAIAVDVKEYRNKKLISTTRRDVQIIVINCNKEPAPKRIAIIDSLSVDNSTTTTYTIEAGNRLSFNLRYMTDSSQSNVTDFKYSGFVVNPSGFDHNPQFSYKLNHQFVTAYFTWQTSCKDANPSPYTITVAVYDTGCQPKITYEGIKIFVTPFKGANHITGPDPACQGVATLYNTNVQRKGYKLVWDVVNGTYKKGPNDSSIWVTWGNFTTGTIHVIGYNTITGCKGDTVTKVVKINPKPKPLVVSGPPTSCFGNTNSYSVVNKSTMNYTWTVKGGTLTSSSNTRSTVQVNWTKADTNKIKVVGVDSNGCQSDTANLSVLVERPLADSIYGSYSVCPNSSGVDYWVTYQAGAAYYWKVTGGNQVWGGNTNHIKIDWGEKGGGEIDVYEITAHNCPGDTVKLMVTKDYVLYTSPIRGDTSLCEFATQVPYQVSFSNGSKYNWKITGGTIVGGNGTASILVDWDKAGMGALEVQETAYDPVNNKPCIGVPVSIVISIHPIPNTSEIRGPVSICENDIAVYSVKGLPGSTYTWKFHGVTNSSTTDTARWQETGLTSLSDTIHVEVTEMSEDSCPGPTRYLVVTVHKTPVTSQIKGPSLVCFPDLKGAVYSVTGFNASTYQWTVDGGAIVSGDKTNTIVVDWYVEGNRSVHVQELSDFGCAGDAKALKVKVDSLALDMDLVTTNRADDREIDIFWSKKNDSFFNGYFKIYRSQQGQEFFRLLDSVPNTQTYYVDKTANTAKYSYQYRVQAVNSCGVAIKTSAHRTINLQALFDKDTTINVHWNPYQGWPVDKYEVNTSDNTDTTLTIYGFTKDTSYAVIKTLEGYRLCMRIAAYKAGSGVKNVISWSNKVCIDLDPVVWIPNAFTPGNGDNINNTFHVFAGNYKKYQIDIYNRWGEHVFTSTNPAIQWDGTFKGNRCVEGVYLYIVNIDGAKTNLYRKGTITLLR